MERSRSELAETLDEWVTAGRVAVTETNERIAVYQLTGAEARQLLILLENAEWGDRHAEDDGGEISPNLISDDLTQMRVFASKPNFPDGVEAILTKSAFAAALSRSDGAERVWVHGLLQPFETETVRFSYWDDDGAFVPREETPDPRKVVRRLDDGQAPISNVGRWVLRDATTNIEGEIFDSWRRVAIESLSLVLAQEVEPDGRLLFRGPPATRFLRNGADNADAADFESLQRAAGWVYESGRELENRHGLFAAEIARTALRDGNLTDFSSVTGAALEGARIAYNFGLTQQSRDALKSLSDLRKAVSDETAKLSESTRALAAAIAGAMVGNIGLIVARLTLPATNVYIPWAAVILGVVLALYVGSVITNGIHFLRLQRDIRRDWKAKLYRFLSDDEYHAMVSEPARRAEAGFKTAAWIGGAMAALLLVAVCLIAFEPLRFPQSGTEQEAGSLRSGGAPLQFPAKSETPDGEVDAIQVTPPPPSQPELTDSHTRPIDENDSTDTPDDQ